MKKLLRVSVLLGLVLLACSFTACPEWAQRTDPIDQMLLYIDRIAGYTDSGVDITIALYDEGRITNEAASAANKAFKRIHTTNESLFRTPFAGTTLGNPNATLTNTARAQLERGLATLKSDVVSLTPDAKLDSKTTSRINFYLAPLRTAVSEMESMLTKVKYKGTGTGATFELTAVQVGKVETLRDKLQTVGREVQAWKD